MRAWAIPLLLAVTTSAHSTEAPQRCAASPKVVAACFKFRGRLSIHNGIPVRIWRLGTRRMVAVVDGDGSYEPVLPGEVEDLLGPELPGAVAVYGDYEVCPLTKLKPGAMQFVCMVRAANLTARRLP